MPWDVSQAQEGLLTATRNLCACHNNNSFSGHTQSWWIYNCQEGNEATKCAMWGGHMSRVFTYVRTYIHKYMPACVFTYVRTYIHKYMPACVFMYVRTCVTLRNAIFVWPTHTLHVGPRVYYVHVCHCTHGCGGRRARAWRRRCYSTRRVRRTPVQKCRGNATEEQIEHRRQADRHTRRIVCQQ